MLTSLRSPIFLLPLIALHVKNKIRCNNSFTLITLPINMEYFFYKTINLKSKLSVIYRYEYYIYIQRDEMSFVSKTLLSKRSTLWFHGTETPEDRMILRICKLLTSCSRAWFPMKIIHMVNRHLLILLTKFSRGTSLFLSIWQFFFTSRILISCSLKKMQ